MRLYSATISLAALVLVTGCASEATAPESASLVRGSLQLQGSTATGITTYNNIPTPLPPNVPSQGFQCCGTSEVGDLVALAGTARQALSATVLMSDWAKHSDYPSMDAAGYTHPITLNIYNVDNSGTVPALGTKIRTVTQTFLIPWRPEADAACTEGRWKASDDKCYSGFAFTIEFDLKSITVPLPDQVIFGVAYNTNTWGYVPIGSAGPYESLNVGTANVDGVGVPPSVGTDVEPDAVFWNTVHATWYSDGGIGGSGTFRRDLGWTGYSPAVRINTYEEATSVSGCSNDGWRKLARSDASSFRNQGDCVSFVTTGK